MATGIQGTGAGTGAVAARGSRLRAAGVRAARAPATTYLFAAAAAASAALLLLLNSRLTFMLDDWEFLVGRQGWSADSVLLPHGQHIAIGLILVYKGLLETAGLDASFAFQAVSVVAFIASVAVLFVLLRRRVDPWLALGACVVVLFLGTAYQDLLWSFQLAYFVSMACGLGMLLALERGDRTGDRLACALLVVSLLFSSVGLPFAAGAVAAILLGPRDSWRRRAYVAAVPLFLFAIWWLGWGREAETTVTATNVATAPLFLIDGLASSLSALFGLATSRDESAVGALDWGRPLLAVALVLCIWRVRRLRRVPPGLLVAVAITIAFWLLAGFNESEGRAPDASRYQYIGVIFWLLIAAELLRGLRLSRPALAGLGVVVVLSVASNLAALDQGYRDYRRTSEIIRADLAAIEIARDRVAPGFLLTPDIAMTGSVHIAAGEYFSVSDRFGSPAYSEAELWEEAPEHAREAADLVLANAVGISFELGAEPGGGSCVRPEPNQPALVELPPGGVTIEARGGAPAPVRLRRYAREASPVVAGEVPAGGRALLEIPTDRSPRPWRLELETSGGASVCGLATTGGEAP